MKRKIPMQLKLLIVAAVCCIGCGDDSGSAPKELQPAARKGSEVIFVGGVLTVDGVDFEFPCKLQKLTDVLGAPDRTSELANTIYTWDDLGFLAYCRPKQDDVHNVTIDFVTQEFDFSPQKGFSGRVTLKNGDVNSTTTTDGLIAAGLQQDEILPFHYSTDDGRYSIIAEVGNGMMQSVSISVSHDGE